MVASVYINFAYGSNMSIARLRRRTPSARVVCKGLLRGHRLAWHKRGRDHSGKCDARPTGDGDDRVWGALVVIAERERERLHLAEDLGQGYEEHLVKVESSLGMLEAHMFRAIDIDESLRPYDWYKQHVLRGARELGLPAGYIQQIAGVEAIADPDQARARHERGH